jgi:HAD superfamily hydrolase (TIGR01544 family)
MPQQLAVACAAGAAVAAAYFLYRQRRETTTWVAGEGWLRKRPIFSFTKADDLLVITDFDATITTGDSDQCHDLCAISPHMSEDFRKEFAPLLDWSTNTDIDGVEWWDVAHGHMIKHGMPPRQMIPRIVREARMVPRPGALELLKRLQELDVPVLIVSAGLSDIIEEFLRQYGALSENVTVCSNRLNYAADSTPKSVSPSPPITSFTKGYAYSSASSFFEAHKARRQLIVLGDSITDTDASKNVPHDHCLSVGFLNSRPSGIAHMETFDAVVMGNEGSLLPVAELIEEIAPRHRTFVSSLSGHFSPQGMRAGNSVPR